MRTTFTGAIAVLALALAPMGVAAQDDMMTAAVPHPSHIHTGDCSMPGGVVAPLSDVGPVGNDRQGSASSLHVDIGTSTVEMSLADMLASDHLIMVHRSAADMGTFIACGAIGGHDVDGSLLVGIGPMNDSGYAGVAWLTDNGDGTTDVQVTILHALATDMDSAMGDDAMAAESMAPDDMSADASSAAMGDDMDSAMGADAMAAESMAPDDMSDG
jgi:hypothetical protein